MSHTQARNVLIALVAIAVGAAAGYWLGAGVHTSQHRVLIQRELTNLATIVDALEALDRKDDTAAVRLIETRMQRSVADLTDLTLIRVGITDPELLEAVRKTERYGKTHGMASTSDKARIVSQQLGSP